MSIVGGSGGGLSEASVVALTSGTKRWFLRPDCELNGESGSVPTRTYLNLLGGQGKQLVWSLGTTGYPGATFITVMPPSWDEGTFRYRVYWAPSNTDTGAFTFALNVDVTAPGTITGTPAYATNVNSNGSGAAYNLVRSAWSSSFSISGATSGDLLIFEWFRDLADAYTGTVYLWGIELEYTTNAPTDA